MANIIIQVIISVLRSDQDILLQYVGKRIIPRNTLHRGYLAYLFVLSLNIRTMITTAIRTIKAKAKITAIDRAAVDTLSLLLLLSSLLLLLLSSLLLLLLSSLLLLIQLMLMSIERSELVYSWWAQSMRCFSEPWQPTAVRWTRRDAGDRALSILVNETHGYGQIYD